MSFEHKAFLVTGASRGIGRAVALALGARGATVAVHFGRRRDAAADVVAAIERSGGRAFAVGADLAAPAAPAELIAQVRETLDAEPVLDGIVHSAGALVPGGLEQFTVEDFDYACAVNVRAPLLVTRAALPYLRPGSRVITISATIVRWANPDLLIQSATKAALQDASRNLAAELGPRGVGVVDVAPGVTRTDLAAGLLQTPGAEDELAATTALGRVGEPEDVADAIVVLLTPEARWITGHVIEAGGGYRL